MPAHAVLVAAQPVAQQFFNYSAYRFRAEVDWIELRLTLAKPSNFQTVRRRLDVEYVAPIGESDGGACSVFSAKFQAPKSWAEIDKRLQQLASTHPLAEPVQVTGIEIALDAYSRAQSRDELVEMAARFYNGASKLVSANRRASKDKGMSQGLETRRELESLLAGGHNIYIGSSTDAERQHIYLKETDSGGALPSGKHRARTEFTLTGDKVPEPTFSAWRGHDFTAFAPYFKFRRLKDDLPLLVALPLRTAAQIGERRPRKTAQGYSRSFSRNTEADRKLNALAFDALRELTRRWSPAV